MKHRILFICLGNACRSQMAEAFARFYGGARVEAQSAGLSPLDRIPALTLQVLEERGVSAAGQSTKTLLSLAQERFDVVINMSGFPVPRFRSVKVEDWEIRDPYGRPIHAYRATRDAIEKRVRELLDALGIGDSSGTVSLPGR